MGIGAFGAVVCAQDTISGEHVAVKQINRVYEKPDLAKRVTGLIDLDSLSKLSNEISFFLGLARGYEKYFEDGEEKVTHMTEYVATRWYRAPEIMLGFENYDEATLDLMYQMIRYKPEARITAAKALEHPWLAAFYDPEEEEWGTKPQLFTRWREIESLNTVEEFREAIWEEIQEYRTQARSLAEHSMSPVASLRPPVPTVREPIPEEPEPDELTESNEPPLTPEPPKMALDRRLN
ncbi:7856_t:CDS:2, partial [Acaulospora colombiana]